MIRTEALASAGAAGGSIEEFERLVRKHGKAIYNLAYRLTGDREEARDLAQEALVRAYRSFDRFRLGSSFEKWLYRIATNVYIDRLRKLPRVKIESLDETLNTNEGQMSREVPDDSAGPEELVEISELHEAIQKAIQSLPEEYRLAVILCDVQGFSYEEISGILQCSIGTIRSRIHRGRRLLRERLLPYIDRRGREDEGRKYENEAARPAEIQGGGW
ncbi:MAG TPA: sigma-70 family RNA polymerase sigma factor [Firmicutes bacterium]|nr:sigma-70 family RNA polymerase sigma factor [Bacillota bacterium]